MPVFKKPDFVRGESWIKVALTKSDPLAVDVRGVFCFIAQIFFVLFGMVLSIMLEIFHRIKWLSRAGCFWCIRILLDSDWKLYAYPYLKEQVNSHSFPRFSATHGADIKLRNHLFRFNEQKISNISKAKFKIASNCWTI